MAGRIALKPVSYHGKGAIEEIVNEVKGRGFKKIFVCADPDLIKVGVSGRVTSLLDKANIAYDAFSDFKANPTIENIQKGVAALKASDADCIIAVGERKRMFRSSRKAP